MSNFQKNDFGFYIVTGMFFQVQIDLMSFNSILFIYTKSLHAL